MATITKKKALSNFQWADQAKNTTQANAWLIPTTPKLDTNSVIASQLNTPADIFKQKYANQWMTTPVVTTPITPVTPTTTVGQTGKDTDMLYQNNPPKEWSIDSLIARLSGNTSTPTTSWPTNQQNMDALTANVATVAENAKKASDETKSALKYGAQQRDYQQKWIKSQADTAQMRIDRQMADQTLQVDRAIADTDRISKRNIAMVEKVAALQGTGKSSGFGQWMLNLKEDTIRTIDRLKEDLDRAKTASWEEAKLLWENYNRNKEKIDNDFEYQFRDFTNRQTASIAELTTAWYDPVKVNKALGKIYEEAQYKTQELFTNYVNNYQTLNNETRLQSQEIRTQKEFNNWLQKEFISQYIGYNGERLASQTLTDLKWYLDNGQISKNDYDLYTKMIGDNTIATLQQHGTVTEDDLANIEQLLKIWYTPTKAVAYMIQSNPTRFTPQESKTPNIQTYEVNGEKYSWYFDQSGNFVNMSAPWGWGVWSSSWLLDYISSSEWTHWNYNAMYGKWSQTAINLTGMTINQIQDLQKKSVYKDKNGNYVGWAMWKYQIVTGTLNWLKQRLWLTGNELFDEAMQDKMAMALIGSSYDDYQAGKITAEQLQKKVSGIWAWVPNPATGKSTYAADWTNKARADNWEFLAAVWSPWQAQWWDLSMQVAWLTLWLWWTEWERKQIQDNIVKVAQRDWISVQEAKKKLWYSTPADNDFKKNMNEQFDPIRKAWSALSQVKSAITALKNPNATTDLIWIVWLLKSIDPNSVARSDEVANVENARSIIDTFANKWEKLWSGKKLSQEQRTQLINAMQTQVDSYESVKSNFVSEVAKEYENRWLNPKDLFRESDLNAIKKQSTPQQSNIPAWLANPWAVQWWSVDDPLWLR